MQYNLLEMVLGNININLGVSQVLFRNVICSSDCKIMEKYAIIAYQLLIKGLNRGLHGCLGVSS